MYVLIVLVAGSWLAYPYTIPSKEDCEKGYEVVAKTFEDKSKPKPDHICAEVVEMPDENQPEEKQ